jgi:hypothetical protein
MQHIFELFFPAPSLSTTPSSQTTLCVFRVFGPPLSRRAPTGFDDDPGESSSSAGVGVMVIVREPSGTAGARGLREEVASIVVWWVVVVVVAETMVVVVVVVVEKMMTVRSRKKVMMVV